MYYFSIHKFVQIPYSVQDLYNMAYSKGYVPFICQIFNEKLPDHQSPLGGYFDCSTRWYVELIEQLIGQDKYKLQYSAGYIPQEYKTLIPEELQYYDYVNNHYFYIAERTDLIEDEGLERAPEFTFFTREGVLTRMNEELNKCDNPERKKEFIETVNKTERLFEEGKHVACLYW